MSANERQEGGNHYQKVPGEQHWDRIIRLFGLPAARCYFIGNITAYVERYLNKDGIKDLKKARHYIDKLIEEEEKYAKENQPNPYTEIIKLKSINVSLCPRCLDNADKYPNPVKPHVVGKAEVLIGEDSLEPKYKNSRVCSSCAKILLLEKVQ